MNKVVVLKWNKVEGQRVPSGNIHLTNTKYDAYYVNRHFDMLKRVCKEDFEYICITDDPEGLHNKIKTIPLWDKCRYLGGCYNRLYLFSKDMKELIGDKFLTVDLDTTFFRDFSFMFKPKTTTVHKGKVYHPGISFIIAGELDTVWETFYKDIENNIKAASFEFLGTDQAWFNYYLKSREIELDYWTEDDGIYLMIDNLANFKSKRPPSDVVLLSWAGPRDPYQNEFMRLPWVKEIYK